METIQQSALTEAPAFEAEGSCSLSCILNLNQLSVNRFKPDPVPVPPASLRPLEVKLELLPLVKDETGAHLMRTFFVL